MTTTVVTGQPTQLTNSEWLCAPCVDRGRNNLATRMVGDQPWCDRCFYAGDAKTSLRMRKAAKGAAPARARNRAAQKEATEAIATPFIPVLNTRNCHRCKGEIGADNFNRTYCATCVPLVKAISRARCWLRSWQKNKQRGDLRRGTYLITHYQLTVEDFTRY